MANISNDCDCKTIWLYFRAMEVDFPNPYPLHSIDPFSLHSRIVLQDSFLRKIIRSIAGSNFYTTMLFLKKSIQSDYSIVLISNIYPSNSFPQVYPIQENENEAYFLHYQLVHLLPNTHTAPDFH